MTWIAETRLPMNKYIAGGLLIAAGGVLATPLSAGPLVLLGLIATIYMLAKGQNTLKNSGQPTLTARNMLLLAFSGWFFAELLSTAINNQRWPNLDYPLRFMLGIGVFWIVRYAKIQRTEILYYGIAASALAAALMGSYQYFVLGLGRTMGWTNYPIYFGNLSILLCVYAVIAVVTMRENLPKRVRFLLQVSIPLLILAAFFSGSRSSWLGLLGLFVLVDWQRVSYAKLSIGMLFVTACAASILILIPELSSSLRIADTFYELQRIWGGDYATSIGYRLQMWKAALLMFWSSPLIGLGSGSYQTEMANLVASGAIQAGLFQGETNFNQAHSEVMDILASKGLVGLVAYLALLILPFRFFKTYIKAKSSDVAGFAQMGQGTVIAFVLFGLTLATFKIQIYCAVYPLMIAMLVAMVLNLSDAQEPASGQEQNPDPLTR